MIETEDIVGTGVKITVSKDELVQALGVVSRAVSTRSAPHRTSAKSFELCVTRRGTRGALPDPAGDPGGRASTRCPRWLLTVLQGGRLSVCTFST